jgi:hypothetical protein
MTTNFQSLLLAAVFASQIIVLSFALMFKQYTPQQYPKLYPVSKEKIERQQTLFSLLHLALGVGAAVVYVGILIFAENLRLLATVMTVCLLLQIILTMCIAVRLEARIRLAIRAMPPPTIRSAELRRWRITDFVSPLWIGLGLTLQLIGLACAAVVWLHWPNTLALIPASVAGSALLLIMIYALIRGDGFTRGDPYMSPADTFAARQARYRSLFRAGACLGAYNTFILLYNSQLIRFDLVYLFMFFSVVGQLSGLRLVTRWTRDLSERDLSVYQADGGAEVAR